MPDHLHLLAVATADDSDLVSFAHEAKQRTAYRYRRSHKRVLWQRGYYERVLRDDEATLDAARYIAANPVRGGLVAEPRAYGFSGSSTMKPEELDELWQYDASELEIWTGAGTP